ncbi:MAG: pyridoxal-phosphate dependent enzyme [Lachnospiraceae bacterium]|nr:pyridoxal-phosphate dependent enzyme [Lachnospiraceae bacterium]
MKQIALFEKPLEITPVVPLSGDYGANRLYMKRDDMIPFSFGGNKARKAAEFYKEIKKKDIDVVMTYGSNSSNHCRIIANMAAAMGLSCHIISPEENREILYNTRLVEQFGASVETCPVSQVAETIDRRIKTFEKEGRKPYFITGGGHGNPGTESYVKAYEEIEGWEKEKGIHFDYIFHASGTGATQAGLVCGQLLSEEKLQKDAESRSRKIVGISIAREEGRGREVVKDSIREYLGGRFEKLYREDALIFTDKYRCGGYGAYTDEIKALIDKVMKQEGIPMDTTYVGKAFWGMLQYLRDNQIDNKKILFIHTGGTPLYFDRL